MHDIENILVRRAAGDNLSDFCSFPLLLVSGAVCVRHSDIFSIHTLLITQVLVNIYTLCESVVGNSTQAILFAQSMMPKSQTF